MKGAQGPKLSGLVLLTCPDNLIVEFPKHDQGFDNNFFSVIYDWAVKPYHVTSNQRYCVEMNVHGHVFN